MFLSCLSWGKTRPHSRGRAQGHSRTATSLTAALLSGLSAIATHTQPTSWLIFLAALALLNLQATKCALFGNKTSFKKIKKKQATIIINNVGKSTLRYTESQRGADVVMSSLFLLGIFGSAGSIYSFHPCRPFSFTRGAQNEETAEHKRSTDESHNIQGWTNTFMQISSIT